MISCENSFLWLKIVIKDMDATAKAQRGRKLEGEWRKIGDVEGETVSSEQ